MDGDLPSDWNHDPETRITMRLERVRRAMADADYVSAMIEAEELLDESPNHAEGLFLLAESMLELGDAEGAAEVYAHHLQLVGSDIPSLIGLSIARFSTCDIPGAVQAAREAVRLAPDNAEAHYHLGLALERQPNRRSEAVSALAAANQLDPEHYYYPLDLSDSMWHTALELALSRLHPAIQRFWADVEVVLEDLPSLAELRRVDPPITPIVPGLYEGAPPVGVDPWTVRPDALRLFRGNLARAATFDDVVDALVRTLDHEALDWLGLELEDLAEL